MNQVVQPFFVTGFQRSGTTLLRVMLDNHPDIAIPLDSVDLWERYFTKLSEYNDLASEKDVYSLVKDIVDEERIRLWDTDLTVDDVLEVRTKKGYGGVIDAFYSAHAKKKGKEFWGDKDPGNMLRLHLIRKWFPEAKIVHIIRDGRAACLSLARQPFGPNSLLSCAREWREQVWWVRRLGDILGPSTYQEIRYEDLLRDPRGQLSNLCTFLGVSYSEQMLAYHTQVEASVPNSKRHIWPLIDKPPQGSRAYEWKQQLSRRARLCFEKRARDVLQELGYDVLPGVLSGAYSYELLSLLQTGWEALRRRLPIRGSR